jgi:hypothetical protein
MVYVTDTESWQRIVQLVSENSRWDLANDDIAAYIARSYDFVMDLLQRLDSSEPYLLDPAGHEPLQLAKRVRRAALRRGGDMHLAEDAERQFGLPPTSLRYAATLPAPLYLPG